MEAENETGASANRQGLGRVLGWPAVDHLGKGATGAGRFAATEDDACLVLVSARGGEERGLKCDRRFGWHRS